jgi:hypothetical protein
MNASNQQSYTAQIRKEADIYHVWLPELNLISEDPDPATALANLETKRIELFSFYDRVGEPRPKPARQTSDADTVSNLKPFFIKAVTVALVGTILLAAGSVSLTYSLREPLRKAGLKTGRAAIASFTKGLESFSKKEVTPEKEKRIRLALRASIPKLKPYVDELRPLFENLHPPEVTQ